MNGYYSASAEEIASRNLDHFPLEQALLAPEMAAPSGALSRGRIVIIGAGPAGLSAAHMLVQLGHQVTIFETLPVAGGLLAAGIPATRRPPALLERVVSALLLPEITLHLNTTVGRDLSFQQVRQQFDRVILAIGAHRSVPLHISGEHLLHEIYPAISFLERQALHASSYAQCRVAVLGGGIATLDVAREARRAGAAEVRVFYPGSLDQLPALAEEKAAALREGVTFHTGVIPVSILGNEDVTVSGLRCVRARWLPDEDAPQRRPLRMPGTGCVYPADLVVTAFAEQPDFSLLPAWPAPPETFYCYAADGSLALYPGVFLAGDAAGEEARTLLRALASGRRTAWLLHQSLLSEVALEGRR